MQPAFEGLDKALRWLRLQANRKQREVAETAGVTQAMLCSYEQGKRTPSLGSLEKILGSLGTDLAGLSEALAVVSGRGARQRGAEALRAGREDGGRGAAEPVAGLELPQAELLRALGLEQPLSPEEHAAFRQMLEAFLRWMRLLHNPP